MRVAVIGAGVVGITTAYFLREQGCEVSVFEAEHSPAQGASNANAGQLSYSYTDALADPALIPRIPGMFLNTDPTSHISPAINRQFLSWAFGLLVNCTRRRSISNTLLLLHTALRSAKLMVQFHNKFGDQYAHQKTGKIVLLSKAPTQALIDRIELKRTEGSDVNIVTSEEALEIEPTLSHWTQRPAAAIYSKSDEVGDARKFAEVIACSLRNRDVRFEFKCPIVALEKENGKIARLVTKKSTTAVDAVVICAGEGCTELLSPLGIRVPIYPVAGYSATFPCLATSPSTSITVLDWKIVFSRLDQSIRVAGFADINPNPKQHRDRIEYLIQVARNLAPDAAQYESKIDGWVGYRTMTPNSQPIVGSTGIPGVYLNTGHGMLGWTLCAATGNSIAGQVVREYSAGRS